MVLSFIEEFESRIYRDGFIVVKDVPGMARDKLENRGYKIFHIPDDPNSHVNIVMAPAQATFGDVWRKYAAANPISEEVEKSDTHLQKVINDIQQNLADARERILHKLIADPGFVSTFGDDFVVEFGDVILETADASLRDLDVIDIRITQKYRFRHIKENEKSV